MYTRTLTIDRTRKHYNLLLEAGTHRILFTDPDNSFTIKKIGDKTLNSFIHYECPTNLFPVDYRIDQGFLYTVHVENSLIANIKKSEISLDLTNISDYQLILEKSYALKSVHKDIAFYRRYYSQALDLQSQIYEMKNREAERIISLYENNNDYDFSEAEYQFPYVYEYSRISNSGIVESARSINLMYLFAYTKLCNTETLRLETTRAIIESENIIGVDSAYKEFLNKGRMYSIV
jgi:hypothetical protein